jgi:hypothetical protein
MNVDRSDKHRGRQRNTEERRKEIKMRECTQN